jgi:RHS repeat-associated protein
MGHPGHVEYVTDGAGVPYQYFHYSPWGESLVAQTRSPNPTGFTTPYRFNAKELDSESGLFYYGARYYHPVVSKWLGVDPMYHLYPAHTPYNYVMNNPVNLTDPNGMWVKGAGFFRNLFNSDEKILAQDEAAKHAGGEVIKIDGGWRASWSTANEGGNDDVDVNLDEIHMVDFKKGKDRPGTYKTLAHMIDSDFDAWQGRNMRSGLSTWNRIGERADKDVAPKIAETVALWMPPTAAINSIKTMSTGEDLFGDKKEGAWDRYIRPSVNLIPEAGRVLNMTNKFIRGLDYMDKGVNIIETKDVWKGKK